MRRYIPRVRRISSPQCTSQGLIWRRCERKSLKIGYLRDVSKVLMSGVQWRLNSWGKHIPLSTKEGGDLRERKKPWKTEGKCC